MVLRRRAGRGRLPVQGAEEVKKWLAIGVVIMVLAGGAGAGEEAAVPGFYDFTMKEIYGEEVNLGTFRGKVLLVVNVASRCGFTKQYAGLEKLYQTYKDRGFAVLGFPANNFLGQEPGTDSEIRQFCKNTYGVSFPMFSKISVKGKNIHPLYAFLTSKDLHPEHGGAVSWNFNKFLIDRNGNVSGRFGSRTAPGSPVLVQAIEQALAASE